MDAIQHRYEFVVYFDVIHGNPNGDPDNNNSPRIDSETEHGIVTDGCLKRKIRNYVAVTRNYEVPYNIHVKEGGVLTRAQLEAYKACNIAPVEKPTAEIERVTGEWMCKNFFDTRTFGDVMSTGRSGEGATQGETDADTSEVDSAPKNRVRKRPGGLLSVSCGKARGPVQIGYAESLDPIQIEQHAITRCARVNEQEQEGGAGKMGTKYTIPYAMYRFKGTITPSTARHTGFNLADLEVLKESIKNMFLLDSSSARPEMGVIGFYVFEHSSQLGNCPPRRVFDSVHVAHGADLASPARSFKDYTVTLPEKGALGSKGVTMTVVAHEWEPTLEGTIVAL